MEDALYNRPITIKNLKAVVITIEVDPSERAHGLSLIASQHNLLRSGGKNPHWLRCKLSASGIIIIATDNPSITWGEPVTVTSADVLFNDEASAAYLQVTLR